MENIKLVAIDMDGTLLNDNLYISNVNKLKIYEAIRKGVQIVLATGRTFKAAQHYAKELKLDIPIITYNGALIKDTITEEVVVESKLDLNIVKKIIALGEEYNVYTKVYVDDVLLVEVDNEEAKMFSINHRINYKAVGRLSENIIQYPYMVVFKDSIEKIEIIRSYIDKEVNGSISHTFSTPHSLEIMKLGVSKKNSLEFLAERLEIKSEEILAIGNSLNDYDMLCWAGVGVAMKNSDQSLLKKWNNISNFDNNQNGVGYILEKYLGL
ncbi:Cof-type HAD-IIB family hydrolase [Alkaliphilus peptidifermentans]|uniref:Cof subfamily of IIB subfamily of haloacid dehalogenase superfamily/HAD-superfamily hydrolase, subfamily IIB n=1 Tax=Alkaliphilus peptidifermentans DSM 18978 TaxID=1120976 RepID=A0A1G5ISA0_9FIRM|nr:Cof-type HAD-IIB family hydrolase [Alkaliphilus peptidifermentans]SCY78903.1 hypothetical protein SAMN03080606_02491 [Alkaliphilus peptidifermentans DSM 18978]